jgi:centromere protein C
MLSLPRSRSPIKTSLNSAARRSVGPISSPSRPVHHTPIRATSHPAVNRRLDFSTEEVRPSIERSPQKGRELGAARKAQLTALSSGLYSGSQPSSGRIKKRPFSLRGDEGDESASLNEGGTHQTNGTTELDYTVGSGEDSMQIIQDDDAEDTLPEPPEPPEEKLEDEEPTPMPPPKRKGGRPRKLVSTELQEAQARPTAARQGDGRVPRSASVDIDASQVSITATKLGRGRPPKKLNAPVLHQRNGDASADNERPAKRVKNTSTSETPRAGRPPKRTKPPPSQRDPNAKVTSVKKAKAVQAASVEPEPAPRNNGRPKPRSLQIIRSGTPADDSGSRTTRSGRTSVKPLAYWRNERIVYGEDDAGTKERYLLPTIKEVIRTEDVEPPRPRKATKGRSKAAGRKRALEDVEEEDEDLEPWEMEEGIMRGVVRSWNSGQGPDNADEDENGA